MAKLACHLAAIVTLLALPLALPLFGAVQSTELAAASGLSILVKQDGQLHQPVRLAIRHLRHPRELTQAELRVSEPERQETQEQWAIQQSYANKADRQSRDLLTRVLRHWDAEPSGYELESGLLDAFNPTYRKMTELVCVPTDLSSGGDRVTDAQRRPLPSQRLVADDYRDVKGKESLNSAFPFHVPEGQVRLPIPFAVMCPEIDPIPNACKNSFFVNRLIAK